MPNLSSRNKKRGNKKQGGSLRPFPWRNDARCVKPGQADNPLNDLIRQKGEETKKVIAQERTLACQRFRPHLWVSRLSGRVVILSGKGTRRNRSSPKIATTKMGNGSSLSGIDLT